MMLPYNTANHLFRCGLIALSLSSVANAANIEVSKFIEVGATTTDNLTLEELSNDRESELVFNIKPSVELKFSGNRFGLVALGQVEYYRFNEAKEDVVDPRLFLRARGTLIDGLMFLDSSLVLSKLTPDASFLRPADDGDTAATVNTKAFINHSFGRVADLYTGYTFETLATKTGEEFESNQHTVDFSIGRNPKYGGVIWGFGGFYSRDESPINEFEDAYLYGKIGGSLTQTVLAEFTYGVEDRELINSVNTVNPIATEYDNTSLWNAQLNWSPNELTTLTVGYGERFLGSGPNMQLKHRVRNSSIVASYTRDITRQAAALDGIATLGDNIDPTIIDTDTVDINNANNVTPLDEPYVDNRFQLAYKLAGRRSDIIIDTVYSDQERLTGDDTIRSLLSRLVFDRRLSQFLSLRLQYDHQKSKASNRPALTYTENRFAIKIIYNFDGNDQLKEDQFKIE